MGAALDLKGQRFGRLLVQERTDRVGKNGARYWKCLCDCGRVIEVRGTGLKDVTTKSCGCKKRDFLIAMHTKHGLARAGDESSCKCWWAMLDRCHNPKSKQYKDYGARGVSVCQRWRESFPHFRYDMGQRPSVKHSLDRINNDGNYEPTNCRWATREEQIRNRRTTKRLTLNNKTQTVIEWAQETGIPYTTIRGRMVRGWDVERILTEPINTQFSRSHNHV